jgi:penicillin-binding protein 2B
MKIYAYLCAIDSGKYDGNYRLKSGSITIGDDEVRDWNRTGWGHIKLDQGLLYSSNVAASTLVQKVINKSELRECLEKFGFGDVTGIELAHEAAGDVGFTYPIEVATATFGQGVTTTGMQQLQGMSILANDGKMVKPHIVDKIIDPNTDESIYESVTEKTEKLVKTSSVEYINNLLYQAVNGDDYNATGLYYKLDGYDVLGKTGTAQIAAPTGGYLEGPNDYINSFVGMYPKNNPEIIIYVAVQQPTWGANQPVVNATKEMIVNITKYLNLFDDGTNKSEVETHKLESYISKNTNVIKEKLESKKIEVITIGNGEKIINQYPKKGTNVLSYDKVFLITNDSEIKLPNFVGYSKKEAENLLNLLNIRYNINGNGYVVSQDIEAGILVTNDLTIKLELQDKYNLDTN